MINEQDKRVIETMARAGCEEETLFSMFPKVPKEEIVEIRNAVINVGAEDSDAGKISINCS